MKSEKSLLCIHGHFYQPPREDPFTGEYQIERSAAPFRNWNERITAECYQPIAEVGGFGQISFNLGGTLARWMAERAHPVYGMIIESARSHYERWESSNAIAQSVHHTILPLARERDKRCQIQWGIASFLYRFGYRPQGLWLPEMAVDLETLDVVAESGLSFVILSDSQVEGELTAGAGPYRVSLPGNRSIAVFVRDDALSNYLSFQMPAPEHTGDWINHALKGKRKGRLTLIATDGETFGHHQSQGVKVLKRLLNPTERDAYAMTTLGRYLKTHPPTQEIRVIENSAWSCSHRLGRWLTGCACTPGCGHWKGALRRALDNLSRDFDEVYMDILGRRDVAPWRLRDDYIRVVMNQVAPYPFLSQHRLEHLTSHAQKQILNLLRAQYHRQRMFVSCSFFFADLDRIEPRYAIANAVQAMALVYYATGEDLTRSFRRDLRVTISGRTGRSGAEILDEIMKDADFGQGALGGDMALQRPEISGVRI
jgi:alpha-amylase/alpha-mannosidase (GH57 family)